MTRSNWITQYSDSPGRPYRREPTPQHWRELEDRLQRWGGVSSWKRLEQLGQVARPKELGSAEVGGRAGIQVGGVDVSKELKSYQKSRGKKSRTSREIDDRTAVKMIIHKRMVETIDLKRLGNDDGAEGEAALRERVTKAVVRMLKVTCCSPAPSTPVRN